MKSVTRFCTLLLVTVFTASMVFAQNNSARIETLSKAEMAMMQKVEQLSVHPNYQAPDNLAATPITSFPYFANFEDGSIPAEFDAQPGSNADVRTDADAAYQSSYGLLFEGNTSSNYGSTPSTYAAAFDPSKSTHFGTVLIDVVPSGSGGVLKMQFMLQQGYSFNTNYNWFRVLVDGNLFPDEDGGPGYYQALNPVSYMGEWSEKTWDLSAYQGGGQFQITLQSSCKYYEDYYQSGDVVHIDDFQIWYMLDPGDIEGYVLNGDGLTISGATVGIENFGVTTSGPDGYYFLGGAPGGDQTVFAGKSGYNTVTEIVNVPPLGLAYQDFILTQPTMFITPTFHDVTLNPNEYYTTQTGVLNTGDGPLAWQAEIQFPVTDTKVLKTLPRTNVPENVDASPMTSIIQVTNPNRDQWDVQFNFPTSHDDGEAGIESDGQYIFTTKWNGSAFYQYDIDGTYLGEFTAGSAGSIRDLAYVPSTGYFYGAAAATTVYIMDFYAQSTVGTITAPTAARAIAYDDDLDGFYANNWDTDITLFDRETGAQISSFPSGGPGSYYGFAYDNVSDGGPFLWGFSQGGSGGVLVQFELPSGTPTGFTVDVIPLVGGTQIAGGLFTQGGLVPGFVTIGGILQNELIFGLELAEGGGPSLNWLTLDFYEGTVTPNGGLQNIPTNFDATGTQPGEVYTADIVFTSTPDVGTTTIPCTMTILGNPLTPPTNLEVTLMNDLTGQVNLTWDWTSDAFQYFIVRRDGQVVASTTNQYYTDYLPDYGDYCYTVQAVYDEGQTAPAGPECIEWPNPTIFIDPDNLEAWVWPDNQVTVTTTINNTGTGTLQYEFPEFSTDFTCDYQVAMYDDYGDGWNGGELTIYVEGTPVLSNITLSSGAGPAYQSFTVNGGDEITSTFVCGSWCYECSYEILDCDGNVVYTDGAGGVNPSGIPAGALYAVVPPPGFVVDVQPATGIIPEGGSQEIVLTYDATGFPAGTFTQDVLCESNDPVNPEVYVYNTMHVYIPGNFAGTVTDGNTGMPINGVTVTAGAWQTTTDPNGDYSLYVDEDTYDVSFTKLGYQPVIVADTFAQQGIVTPIDVMMYEEPYAPAWVTATVNDPDTECLVEWSLPQGPYEILYDDGTAEELVVWASAGGENAVKFTPAGYPASVVGGRLFVGDGTFPAGNWFGTEFAIIVYDDDGANGMPGTVLDSIPVIVGNYGWIEFWGNAATIEDGDFYLSMKQLTYAPDAAPLGVDYTTPTVYRSYSRLGGTEWTVSVYQDFMMRAYVDGPQTDDFVADGTTTIYPPKLPEGVMGKYFFAMNGTTPSGIPGVEKGGEFQAVSSESVAANRDVVDYEVARISDFDPIAGPETGTATIIASGVADLEYNDVAFGGLPMGWYAYAVRAYYTNGDASEWEYSNTVGHLKDVVVNFEITLSTGDDPEDVDITMTGEDYPYNTYFGVTDATGLFTFDSVIKGNYSISVYKVAYEEYAFTDNIQEDKTYIIQLCEKRYPPRNLWVDPLTSWAYWDWPIVEALWEEFEDPTFPPKNWQALTNDIGWFRTDDGSSSGWTIPAWDSYYACANDDAAGSTSDGSMDYLITPPLDLREADDFALMFDSFYDGAFGQLAFVEYTYDGGATWEVLYAMPPTPGAWTQEELDLTAFSGLASQAPIWFAFHADDNGQFASGWAIDNVIVANGLADPIDFHVFLDGAYVATSDTNSYQYVYLTYGVTYEASVAARYTCGLSAKAYYTFTSEYLIPPRNLEGEPQDDAAHIWWEAPLTPATFLLMNEEPRTEFPNQYSEYSPMVQEVDVISNGGTNRDLWDVTYNYPCGFASGEAGIETDGNFIYTTQWNAGNGTFFKYDLDGTYLGPFTVSGCQDIRDLAYDPTTGLMFGSNAGTTVWGMNFVDLTVDMTIAAPTAARAIAYDNDNDGFWANNWDTPLTLFDKTGATISTMNVGAFGSLYGLAYDNWADGGPYLWAFSQAGSGAVIVQYDIATGAEIFNLDVLPLVGGTQIAGGLYTHCNQFGNNVVTIGGILQNELIFGLEYVPCGGPGPQPGGDIPENLIGYNVYRDMEVVAYVPFVGDTTSEYYDLELEPITYQYDVSALYDLAPYGFPGDTGESALEGPIFIQIMYGHPLPFNEPWLSGSFDLNEWSHEGNWRVNGQIGDPEPSAEFTWDPVLTDYRSALTSFPIDGYNVDNPYIDGCIWFDFDVRLDDRNTTGGETLKVEVGNEDGWTTVAEYSNADGSFDWTSEHIDITPYAFGKIFRLRFVAEGANSNDIQSWFVDNIEAYRACHAPYDLVLSNDPAQCVDINMVWNSPVPCAGGGPGPGPGQWINWDNGENAGGIGLTGGGVFSVASHWDPDDLTAFDGSSISKIRFVPFTNAVTTTFTLKVWEGPNAQTLLYEETLSGLLLGEWNEITLSTPVPIDVTKELWFGYTVDSPDGENPAGHDPGPAVAGYGDMITLDGVAWDPLSSFGAQFDVNWNLQAFVEATDGETVALTPREDNTVYPTPNADLSAELGEGIVAAPANNNRVLQGYNIFVDGEFVDFTADTTYVYTVSENGTYVFDVYAVYEDCESETSATGEFFIGCVGIDELSSEGVAIYPNPATDVVNIMATEEITFVTIMNNVGQVVYNNKVVNENVMQVNTSAFEAGVYMIKVETANNVMLQKVIIAN